MMTDVPLLLLYIRLMKAKERESTSPLPLN